MEIFATDAFSHDAIRRILESESAAVHTKMEVLRRKIRSLASTFASLLVLATALLQSAMAQITEYDLSQVATFSQTTTSPPTVADNYQFVAFAHMNSLTDFDHGTLIFPGPGSPAQFNSVFQGFNIVE